MMPVSGFSLTPRFSGVQNEKDDLNRFNGFMVWEKTVETVSMNSRSSQHPTEVGC